MTAQTRFPDGFLWGAATASYQIEGAVTEDGRGPSIWDTFSHTPGRVIDATTGDTAADHYHRYREDVAMMSGLGLQAYRLSVAWPRVVPGGSGAPNEAGLDFYSRLVDELLARQIRPFVTLYHWDLPQALDDAGGWTNRDTAARFGEYAHLVAERLGDRVDTFTTLNEPWCSAYLGYASGVHAPGHTDLAEAYAAVHHLLLAHGLGVAAVRAAAPGSHASITLNPAMVRAASDSPADLDAMRHVDGISNRIFLDPLLHGAYPADVIDDLKHVTDWSFVADGDLATIQAPIDMLGVNYYTPVSVTADPTAGVLPYPGSDKAYIVAPEGPFTAMGWRIEPGSFTELLVRLQRDYPGVPLMITENGAAFDDVVTPDDGVHDGDRIDYLRGHLGALHDAIESGVDVRGYFVWSLMDNFEWALGLSKRFGIVHVDYETQQRRLKDSATWYSAVIAANGLT